MKKKLIALAIGASAATTLFSGVQAFALGLEGSKSVPVTYDSSTSIPDPDNPTNPTYQVVIPSAITFTEVNKPVDASVSIKDGQDKSKPYVGSDTVKVSVSSQNNYKVTMNGSNDDLNYNLSYGAHTNDGSIGNLTQNNAEIKGQAVLKDPATKVGNHTDTLTYTVQTQ